MLGAFARIFTVDSPARLADAFTAARLTWLQLNLNALGRPTIPTETEVSTADLTRIADTLRARGVAVWGVSATFNTAHPDPRRRAADTERAADFIGRLGPTGAVAATLCSGSRDPVNMWGFHPNTASPAAWRDFRAALDALLPAAERAGVRLAVEPEPANTVLDVDRALRLRDELGADADRIGFILDPANLITGVDPAAHRYTLERAFAELGAHTICVHAKDTVAWAETLRGAGVVDYDLVAALYRDLPRPVPLIVQDASPAELPSVLSLLRAALSGIAA